MREALLAGIATAAGALAIYAAMTLSLLTTSEFPPHLSSVEMRGPR
jgi:hypothetical protein